MAAAKRNELAKTILFQPGIIRQEAVVPFGKIVGELQPLGNSATGMKFFLLNSCKGSWMAADHPVQARIAVFVEPRRIRQQSTMFPCKMFCDRYPLRERLARFCAAHRLAVALVPASVLYAAGHRESFIWVKLDCMAATCESP